jgi:uncharacterized membrane protein YphA (DoxX/SURF4 family)
MKALRIISRIIIGLTFIYSGFVKGVDPLGTMYKIEDYFIAYQMDWALSGALPLAYLLVCVEFMIGISLLLNLKINWTTWLLLAIMSFFTVITLLDALNNPVPDCGCFGEAIKLTNWETFYKNIVLMGFTLIIVWTHKMARPLLGHKTAVILLILTVIGFTGFTYYNQTNLPMIDFREWKTGNNMKQSGEPIYNLIYENTNTAEQRSFLSSEIPWQDSTWTKTWKFVKQQIDYSNVISPHHVEIVDNQGDDVTRAIIEHPGYHFIATAYSLEKASPEGLKKLSKLSREINTAGYNIVLLTGSLQSTIQKYEQQYRWDLQVYQADDIELKTMVRATPGLILMKDGTILKKWHYHNFPQIEEILNLFSLE